MEELLKALIRRFNASSMTADKAETSVSIRQGMFDHDSAEWDRVRADGSIPPSLKKIFHQRMQASARLLKTAKVHLETAQAIVSIDREQLHKAQAEVDSANLERRLDAVS